MKILEEIKNPITKSLMAMEKLGSSMAKKKITIMNSPQPSTNGTEISLPLNSEEEELFGYVSHESFHIRAKSFSEIIHKCEDEITSNYPNVSNIEAHLIVNIIEDFRIEQWLKRTYIGSFGFLIENSEKIIRNQVLKIENEAKISLKQPNISLIAAFILILNHTSQKTRNLVLNLKNFPIPKKYTDNDIKNIMNSIESNPSIKNGAFQILKLAEIYSELKQNQQQQNQQQQNQQQQNQQQQNQQQQNQQQQNQQQQNQQQQNQQQQNQQQQNQQQQNQQQQVSDEIENSKNNNSEIYCSKENEEEINDIEEFINDLHTKSKDLIEKELEKSKEEVEKEIEKIISEDDVNKEEENKNLKTFKSQFSTYTKDCIRISGKEIEKTSQPNQIKTGNKRIEIVNKNKQLINKIKGIIDLKADKSLKTRGNSSGRLNRDVIKAIASNYTYKNIYSRNEITSNGGKILFIVDLSSSMEEDCGRKMNMLREAIIICAESLTETVDISIVGFSGTNGLSYTFVFKEFGEPLNVDMLDNITKQTCGGGTPTAIAIESELRYANIENSEQKIPVILITDGEPDEQKDVENVMKIAKKQFKFFGIGIELYKIEHFKKCFGENFISINNSDQLKTELIRIAKLIIRNF